MESKLGSLYLKESPSEFWASNTKSSSSHSSRYVSGRTFLLSRVFFLFIFKYYKGEMESKLGSLYFFYLYLNITKVKWNPSLDHFTYLRKSFWASNTKSSSSHSSRYASGRTFLLTKTAWYIFFLHSSSLGSPHAAATQSMYTNCKIAIEIHNSIAFNREVLDTIRLLIPFTS